MRRRPTERLGTAPPRATSPRTAPPTRTAPPLRTTPVRATALPTAPLAAATLIAGYGAVVASGSRTVGGLVLVLGGALCIRIWTVRHGARTAWQLAGVGFAAFVVSHVLGLVVGAWPAVLIVAAAGAAAVWSLADSRMGSAAGAALAFRRPRWALRPASRAPR